MFSHQRFAFEVLEKRIYRRERDPKHTTDVSDPKIIGVGNMGQNSKNAIGFDGQAWRGRATWRSTILGMRQTSHSDLVQRIASRPFRYPDETLGEKSCKDVFHEFPGDA